MSRLKNRVYREIATERGHTVKFRALPWKTAWGDEPTQEEFSVKLFEVQKKLKLERFGDKAKQESVEDLTTSDGLVFHTDPSTMIHIQGLKGWFGVEGNDVYPNYKNADGSVNNLTEANIDTAIADYTTRLYGIYSVKYATKKAEIEAATTIEELKAITW